MNLKYKFHKFVRFEFALNFKGIQTFQEKSQKFSKIMVCQVYTSVILDYHTCIEKNQVS
jgi:hypothetical protein